MDSRSARALWASVGSVRLKHSQCTIIAVSAALIANATCSTVLRTSCQHFSEGTAPVVRQRGRGDLAADHETPGVRVRGWIVEAGRMTVVDLIKELKNVDQGLHVVTADDFPGIMLVPRHLLRAKDLEVQVIHVRQ